MNIKMYGSKGCYYCEQARELLKRASLEYIYLEVIPRTEVSEQEEPPEGYVWRLDFQREFPGVNGYPYTIVDGKPIGGVIELAKLLVKEGLVSARKD